jgi:hypothetical protein
LEAYAIDGLWLIAICFVANIEKTQPVSDLKHKVSRNDISEADIVNNRVF